MIDRVEFIVPGVPQSKLRHRHYRVRNAAGQIVAVRTAPNPKTEQAEQTFAARAMAHRPHQLIEGPLELQVTFLMPIPESWPKWKREAALSGTYHHVSKPDLDNLVKLVKDALNGVFWHDDAQIWSVVAVKRYWSEPATEVIIRQVWQAAKEVKAS